MTDNPREPKTVIDGELSLPGKLRARPTADKLYDDLAAALLTAAWQAVKDRGVFHLALSGGSTPEPFFVRLVIDPRYREIPWRQTHAWIVDERCVPEEDPRSNFRMIRESLLDHLPLRRADTHPIPVLDDDPANTYEKELLSVIPVDIDSAAPHPKSGDAGPINASAIPRLDFVLLGMGGDCHTASLFPGSPALDAGDLLIASNQVPPGTIPDVPRVTMTYRLLNAARSIAVLVTGAAKAAALTRVSQQLAAAGPDPATLPITGINPVDGKLIWYVDEPALGR